MLKFELVLNGKNDEYLHWICGPCGYFMNYLTCLDRYGEFPNKPGFDVSTYHTGDKCGVCGKETATTETRDFFYPNIYKFKKPRNEKE